MDGDILGSILTSRRRITSIEVDISSNDGVDVTRLTRVIEHFQKYIKKLKVTKFPRCSEANYFKFLNAASEVEELSLDGVDRPDMSSLHAVTLKGFRQLKCLCLGGVPIMNILDAVADNTLNELEINLPDESMELSANGLQAFLNRQNCIKKLDVNAELQFNVDHLELKELKLWYERNDGRLCPILVNQPLLTSLFASVSEDVELDQICRMEKLENLEIVDSVVTDEMFLQLRNLQALKFLGFNYGHFPSVAVLDQIELPSLQELSIVFVRSLREEHFVAIGRNFPKLQDLNLIPQNDCLAAIINNVPTVKSLLIGGGLEEIEGARSLPARPHLALEKLEITRSLSHDSFKNACYAINFFCPNLTHIEIKHFLIDGPNVLEMMRSHPRLTRFSISDTRTERVIPGLNRWLPDVINVFRDSAEFKHLSLQGIHGMNQQLVQDWIREDDRFEVDFSENNCVKIVKNS